jgi:hypothetical protein
VGDFFCSFALKNLSVPDAFLAESTRLAAIIGNQRFDQFMFSLFALRRCFSPAADERKTT